MIIQSRIAYIAVALGIAIGLMSMPANATDQKARTGDKPTVQGSDHIPVDSSKDPQSKLGDRGQPGINEGGQTTEPGKGEQTGRPGTIFGGSATLPPQDKSPGFEGADKQQRKGRPPTAGGQ